MPNKTQAQSNTFAHANFSGPRHEQPDINVRVVAAVLIVVALSVIVVHVSLRWWLTDMNRASASKATAETTRVLSRSSSPAQPSAAFPILQVSPEADWQTYLEQEQQKLNGYGWINSTAGLVRIPIQDAMEMIASGTAPKWRSTNQSLSPVALQQRRAQQQGR